MNQDFEVDLEKGTVTISEEDSRKSPEKPAKHFLNRVYDRFVDGKPPKIQEENLSSPDSKAGVSPDKVSPCSKSKPESGKSPEKEKRKKSSSSWSNKKAPKPPRPPHGPTLDAADQKLIREIAELAMLKKARIERMKALKKAKAAKAASSSSQGNVLATVFTVIFCLVIIFQGMSPRTTSESSRQPPSSTTGVANDGLVSVQHVGKPPAVEPNESYARPNLAYTGSPNLVEQISGRDTEEKARMAAG